MVQYLKEEMVYDCKKGKDVIVFDTNVLLLLDADRVGRRIKKEFPEVVKLLRIKAVNDQIVPGESVVIKVRGYTIAALVTQIELFGKQKDDPELINMNTINAINDMLSKVSRDSHFVSGILNRKHGKWERISYHISSKKLNWSIMTE